MATLIEQITTRELRAQLSDVLGRTMYAGERIGVTRNGKIAAVLVSVDDFETLEELEMARDVAMYDKVKAADDGTRISHEELVTELDT